MAQTTNEYCYRLLRKYKYEYDGVERFFHKPSPHRRDFCYFADIIAYRYITGVDIQRQFPNVSLEDGPLSYNGCLAIQTCAASTISPHLIKLTAGKPEDAVRKWLMCGNRLEIWGWGTFGPKNARKRHFPKFRRIIWDEDKEEFYYYDNTELEYFGYTTPY